MALVCEHPAMHPSPPSAHVFPFANFLKFLRVDERLG